jgi:nucleoside 2-deoxyribosyltransferase
MLGKGLKRVYLAGPDVFFQDGYELLRQKSMQVNNYLAKAITPFDLNEDELIFDCLPRKKQAEVIAKNNYNLIRSCDVVLANLMPFRGTEPDAGTVAEVGFAFALGKKIIAYNVPKKSYIRQVQERIGAPFGLDDDGHNVEDFDGRINLMLTHACEICDDFDSALDTLSNLP